MKPVKTMPRFQCDFCKRRSTKARMAIHEKRCFRNPNRICDNCDNTGTVYYEYDQTMPCEYCSKFDPQQLKEIQERELKLLDEKKL